MYKICKICFSKVRFGVSKVSSCIIVHLAFFGAVSLFLTVDLAFSVYDYLAILVLFDMHVAASESSHLDAV